MNILIADAIDINPLEPLKKSGHTVDLKTDVSAQDLQTLIKEYDAIFVRSRTKLTRDIIAQADKLQFIGRVGTGLDNIDAAAAEEKKIVVANAPGANSGAVAEHTILLILALFRHLPQAHHSTKKGGWEKKSMKGIELGGKTVGIVGFGTIGQKVAQLARAFGANIITFDRTDTSDKLKELFTSSDVVSLHAALVPETKGLVNSSLLGSMKKTAYLINCARADIVVEEDLYQALSEKKIAGGALDVFWDEPIPASSRWLTLDNLILTPHIAGQTKEAGRKAAEIVVQKFLDYVQSTS